MYRILLVVLLVFLPHAAAGTPEGSLADYERLLEARYSGPIPVPPEGLRFQREEAEWTLESGTVRLLEPTSGGALTGLVFEGRGHFRMEIPDAQELAQLRRMAENPGLAGIDEPFTEMVLRTSTGLLTELSLAPPGSTYDTDSTATSRREVWLADQLLDADARVVGGLLMPGDGFLLADMKTESYDWLSYTFDDLRAEEVVIRQVDKGYAEEWVRLDRAADRRDDGSASRDQPRSIDVEHVDLAVDLRKTGKETGLSGLVVPRRAAITAELTFVSEVDGFLALPLVLRPYAEVSAVRDEDGTVLPFVRYAVGRDTRASDKSLFDDSLLVFLRRPLAAGETYRLSFDYEMEIINYVSGRSWYPGKPGRLTHDFHTATITITSRKKDEIRAMGERVEERAADKDVVQVWKVERPAQMVTFSFAKKFHEETVEREGVPRVTAFSMESGGANKTFNVAADVVNSLLYFNQLFGHPLEDDHLYVTSIFGNHGQSFDGFIHMSILTFDSESEGPSQLFRAHEVAHQWWGHRVISAGYRDQWLSEAFAEYSAMMFLEAAFPKKGKDYYQEIVEAYVGQMLGVVDDNRFAPYPLERNDRQRARVGPISIGYRAATATSPTGYFARSYYKGALVLHMLRTMLRGMTRSDEVFVKTLRDFVERQSGHPTTTDDFVAALNRNTPESLRRGVGDWKWFFDQWVHGTAIPTYEWSYQAASKPDADGKYVVQVEVNQSDVPETFRMFVPVEVGFGKDKSGQVLILVAGPETSAALPLPARPKTVELNPDGAVLARMRKM